MSAASISACGRRRRLASSLASLNGVSLGLIARSAALPLEFTSTPTPVSGEKKTASVRRSTM
jgi:hypothetical protein